MDPTALLSFVVITLIALVLVMLFMVYGTKEVTFEENLEATRADLGGGGKKSSKNSREETKKSKKSKKQQLAAATTTTATNNDDEKEAEKQQDEVDKRVAKQKRKKQRRMMEKQQKQEEEKQENYVDEEELKQALDEEEEEFVMVTPSDVQEVAQEPEPEPQVEPEPVKPVEKEVAAEPVKEDLPVDKEEPIVKKKKKKMVIEEVEEMCEAVKEKEAMVELAPEPQSEAPVVQEEKTQQNTQPSQQQGKKKKKGSAGVQQSGGDSKPFDLITAVRKTALSEEEVQQVIDILLNKQAAGFSSSSSDWVEPTSSGDKNEIKQLQRQLNDKENALAEEMTKVKVYSDRVNVMRKELNAMQSNQASTQRYIEDLQNQNKHAVANLEARYNADREAYQRDVANLQAQIQYHISHAQNIQTTLDQFQAQPPPQPQVDPALFAELDQLRQTKINYEADLNNLQNQLGLQQEETAQIQNRLTNVVRQADDAQRSKDQLNSELNSARDQVKKLSDKCSALENKSSSDTGLLRDKLDELTRSKKELEVKLAEMGNRVSSQEQDLNRVQEENERLSEQLTATVERPVVEGQEEAKQNGDHFQEEDPWHKKYLAVSQEHEQTVKEQDVIKKQLTDSQSQLDKVKAELEEQRAKNNEKKVQKDTESAEKAFLKRLFPEVPQPTTKVEDHASWLEEFSQTIRQKNNATEDQEVTKLEGQVGHYQKVLAETEEMLNKLQASVESEESRWKSRLAEKDSHIAEIVREKDALANKAAAMEASINSLNSAQEMEEKLNELQEKLSNEEVTKRQLVEEQEKSSQKLSQEVEDLKRTLEDEKKGNADLGDRVAKMGQLVTTGQEALQQEQKTVEMLRQQLAAAKSADSSPALGNGPSSSTAAQEATAAD